MNFYWQKKKGMMMAILIGFILFCVIVIASIVYIYFLKIRPSHREIEIDDNDEYFEDDDED